MTTASASDERSARSRSSRRASVAEVCLPTSAPASAADVAETKTGDGMVLFACGQELGDRCQLLRFQSIPKCRHVGLLIHRLGIRDPRLQPFRVAFPANACQIGSVLDTLAVDDMAVRAPPTEDDDALFVLSGRRRHA